MLKVNQIQHKTPELYYKSQELLIETPNLDPFKGKQSVS